MIELELEAVAVAEAEAEAEADEDSCFEYNRESSSSVLDVILNGSAVTVVVRSSSSFAREWVDWEGVKLIVARREREWERERECVWGLEWERDIPEARRVAPPSWYWKLYGP